jgi:triacylglycerol lipase
MKKRNTVFAVGIGAVAFLAVNSQPWGEIPATLGIVSAALLPIAALVSFLLAKRRFGSVRWAFCSLGYSALLAFLASAVLSVVFATVNAVRFLWDDPIAWLIGCAVCIVLEAVLFWFGIICIYCTSLQLGIGLRVLGIAVGMIPLVNLAVLIVMLRKVGDELAFEGEKCALDRKRRLEKVCATRYPVLLVHGVFFRDSRYFNYWGRIPAELERNGATVYYGNHQSARSVADSGKELAARIREIVRDSGCEKLHIIAHSKGGLDCRWALAHEGIASMVASLTTVNTPHRGCEFADYLLQKAPEALRQKVAAAYRAALIRMGDTDPDFLAAVGDLTASRCKVLNADMPMPEGVFCCSVGSVLKQAGHGQFPLNFSYLLVKHFDGANDGLVGETSFAWGTRYTVIKTRDGRGVSHADVIDLTRRNVEGFDVREFYVALLSEFKKSGM